MTVRVIGAGLSGAEVAWQLAERGHTVRLCDMKPVNMSPAHRTPLFAELVCSNSMRSDDKNTPSGLLKDELRKMDSVILQCADAHRVPAGTALAIERVGFSRAVTMRLAQHPRITIERGITEGFSEETTVLCTGPLTTGNLAESLQKIVGEEKFYFYDAIAPIVATDSIDFDHAFYGSRWDKNQDPTLGDYINCSVNKEQYIELVREIRQARKVIPHHFEKPKYFEGCLPIDVMAERGEDVLRFGPMRPVGLDDPRTGKWPYAVVQLRPENPYRTSYNLVGFQTRLAYPEQKRVFSIIPALKNADFLRLGSIHRNSYINAPKLLGPNLAFLSMPHVFVGGLLTGVEGYIESCGMGMLAALSVHAELTGSSVDFPPPTTALGGMYYHVTRQREAKESYIPTNINFGLLPPLQQKMKKKLRKIAKAERGHSDFDSWLSQYHGKQDAVRKTG